MGMSIQKNKRKMDGRNGARERTFSERNFTTKLSRCESPAHVLIKYSLPFEYI